MIVEINSARTVSAPNVTATGTQETPSTVFAQEDKWQMDKKLKAQYGFGVDALEYRGGKIIGKTPEAQAVIDSDEGQFMKMSGYAFINLSKNIPEPRNFPIPFLYTKTENSKQPIRSLMSHAKARQTQQTLSPMYSAGWLKERNFLKTDGRAYSRGTRPGHWLPKRTVCSIA